LVLHKFPECLFNSIQNPAISENHGWDVGISVGYTPLLECDAPSIGKEVAMKKKIIKKIIISIIINYSP